MLAQGPVLRERASGFPGESSKYLSKVGQATLPSQLEGLKYAVSWPIDMASVPAHVTSYFGDLDYSFLKQADRRPHFALDIQAPLGTPVFAPVNARIALVDAVSPMNETRNWTDILLQDEETGLAIWMVHLNTDSVPYLIARRAYRDYPEELRVQQGDKLGTVGLFFNDWAVRRQQEEGYAPLLNPEVVLNPEVEETYGRAYDHLHLEIHHVPDPSQLSLSTSNPVNPAALLQRLY